MARQNSYFSSSILERFENALVTVDYSNLPHSQDYLASGNKHATDKIAAELCIHAFYLAMNGACGVYGPDRLSNVRTYVDQVNCLLKVICDLRSEFPI